MILKMDNKSKDFYNIMGRFFGSRIVENKTNYRIYDDNNKEWYVYLDKELPVAFVSVVSGVIKNVYSIKDDFLIELLTHISKETKIVYKKSKETKSEKIEGADKQLTDKVVLMHVDNVDPDKVVVRLFKEPVSMIDCAGKVNEH